MPETIVPKPGDDQDSLFRVHEGAYGIVVDYGGSETADVAQPKDSLATIEHAPKLEDLFAKEMIEIALLDRLPPDIYGLFDRRRSQFIKEHTWTPSRLAEVTAALAPLSIFIVQVNAKRGLEAVGEILKAVDYYRVQATIAIETLREVELPYGEEGALPDPTAIRNNVNVRQELARYILDRNSLNLFCWPRKKNAKVKELRDNRKTGITLLNLTDKLIHETDENLITLWQKDLGSQRGRGGYWSRQAEAVETNEKSRDLVAAARARQIAA